MVWIKPPGSLIITFSIKTPMGLKKDMSPGGLIEFYSIQQKKWVPIYSYFNNVIEWVSTDFFYVRETWTWPKWMCFPSRLISSCTRSGCKREHIVYPVFCESLCYCWRSFLPIIPSHLWLQHQVKAIFFHLASSTGNCLCSWRESGKEPSLLVPVFSLPLCYHRYPNIKE